MHLQWTNLVQDEINFKKKIIIILKLFTGLQDLQYKPTNNV